jgi:uncharacterized protein
MFGAPEKTNTDLLLYAFDSDTPFYKAAAKWWTKLFSGDETVGLCQVVVFGYLRPSTHAKVFERPLKVAEVAAHIPS